MAENASPVCITRRLRNTTKVSPLVCAGAEVVEVDGVVAAEHRQLVGVGAVGEGVLLGAVGERRHLGHAGRDVGVGHDLDAGREVLVAADVVAVGVGVDDVGDRLVGHRLHLVHDRLAPVGQLGVDQHDPVGGDEDGRVAAAAGDHPQVVLHLLDAGDVGPGGGRLLRDDGAPGDGDDAGQDDARQHLACGSCATPWEEHALDEPVRAGQRDAY